MFDRIRNFTNDLLDRPMPTIREMKEARFKKRNPIKFVVNQYVETLEPEKITKEEWVNVSNNLTKLSTAEKNYSQNNPRPSYIRKAIGIVGTLASIFCITSAEKFDVFPTKAWAHVFKERDQD